jgi:serine phosphatase RsbU (regulator of sigma subunit)
LGQINEFGIPLIRNFKPSELKFGEQNWAAVQDSRGVMYFGNQEGYVLEYDSKTWRKIWVKDSKPVRSLTIDTTGTVYVGTIGDFGRLVPNFEGNLVYESLRHLIIDSTIVFNDIYKSTYLNGKVIFQSLYYIFIYNGSTINTIDINKTLKPFLLFQVNNKIYMGTRATGISEVTDTSLVHVNGSDFLTSTNIQETKSIYSILPLNESDDLLIITDKGFFTFNPETGKSATIKPKTNFIDKLISDGLPYHSVVLNDSTVGLGLIYSDNYSFTRTNQKWEPIEVINKKGGLQDNLVTYLYQKQTVGGASPLWLCLNSGITKADIQSPIRKFSEESGINNQIQAITRFNGRLYVATVEGLYYQTFDKKGFAYFEPVPEITKTVWSLSIFKDPTTGQERLLVGGYPKIFEITPDFKVKVVDNYFFTVSLSISHKNPETIFAGSVGGLFKFKWNGKGWSNIERIKYNEIRSEIRHISEDQQGNLWITSGFNGVQRLVFTNSDTLIYRYDTTHGLPSIQNILIFNIANDTYFGTDKGLYKFNYEKEFFEPYTFEGFPDKLKNKPISKYFQTIDGFILVIKHDNKLTAERFVRKSDGAYEYINIPYKALPNNTFDAIYSEANGVIWFGLAKDLYSFNPLVKRNYAESFNALIRKVSIKGGDSVVFNGAYFKEIPDGRKILSGTQLPTQILEFPFKYNNFTFDVAATFFENEQATEYSFILDGLDNTWSTWSIDPRPIYTNLSEGKYVFKVKARNIFGTESNIAEYRFSITPPWFRSVLAYISYILLLIGFIWFVVKWNTRRLIAEKVRLEEIVRQRTAEVVAQKEEIELQNEELESQRDKIFEQNEEIKSSITYASRIQNALMPPMETIHSIFDDIFILFLPRDIVSGDFYWITQFGNRKICAAADCTGHGVPGGFMSMLGMGLLNQIISRNEKITASELLDQLRTLIITSLHQTGKSGESKDGMDISLFIVDTDKQQIEFAGANNPFILIRNDELIQYKGDKMPIGIHLRCDIPFTNVVMEYLPGDIIYTFSDGYQDQFGGPDQRKFMIKNLKELLFDIHKKPMDEQHDILHKTLHDWHGESPRIDDVVLIGVRL